MMDEIYFNVTFIPSNEKRTLIKKNHFQVAAYGKSNTH